MNFLLNAILLLFCLISSTLFAKVPDSSSNTKINQAVRNIYVVGSKELLAAGYKKGFHGVDYGRIHKQGFILKPGASLYVAPVMNTTKADYAWVNEFSKNIGDITAQLLKETE